MQALQRVEGHDQPPRVNVQADRDAGRLNALELSGGFDRPSGTAQESWGFDRTTPMAPLKTTAAVETLERR